MPRRNSNARARHAEEMHGDIILACPIAEVLAVEPEACRAPAFGAAFLVYYMTIAAVLTISSLAGMVNMA